MHFAAVPITKCLISIRKYLLCNIYGLSLILLYNFDSCHNIWLSFSQLKSCKLQVCKFLEVSSLSFLPEYGPKLKEDYVSVRHLPKIQNGDDKRCCACGWFSCCNSNWQKVHLIRVWLLFHVLAVVAEFW